MEQDPNSEATVANTNSGNQASTDGNTEIKSDTGGSKSSKNPASGSIDTASDTSGDQNFGISANGNNNIAGDTNSSQHTGSADDSSNDHASDTSGIQNSENPASGSNDSGSDASDGQNSADSANSDIDIAGDTSGNQNHESSASNSANIDSDAGRGSSSTNSAPDSEQVNASGMQDQDGDGSDSAVAFTDKLNNDIESTSVYTTLISGRLSTITSARISDATTYTTMISGHQTVVTTDVVGKQVQSGKQILVVSNISGKEVVLTSFEATPTDQARTRTDISVPSPDKETVSAVLIPSETAGSSAKPTELANYTESNVPLTFINDPANYFYGVYFPVLLAVLYQTLLGYLYTATKMMEPFAMLSKLKGTQAIDFLWINYLSADDNLGPFAAMLSGHWLILWVAILYSGAQIVSPLSSEMLRIYPGYHQISEDSYVTGSGKHSCGLLLLRL